MRLLLYHPAVLMLAWCSLMVVTKPVIDLDMQRQGAAADDRQFPDDLDFDYDDEYEDDEEDEDERAPSSRPGQNILPVITRGGAEINTGSIVLSAGSLYQVGDRNNTAFASAPLQRSTTTTTEPPLEEEAVSVEEGSGSEPSVIYIKTPPSTTKTVVYVLVPQGNFAYNQEVRVVPYTAGTTVTDSSSGELLYISSTTAPVKIKNTPAKCTTSKPATVAKSSTSPPEELLKQESINESAQAAGGLLGLLPTSMRRLINSFLAVTRRKNYNFFNIFVNSNMYNA